MTRAERRNLMTMMVLALVAALAMMFAMSGCGSDGGNSELVGSAGDVVILSGGVSVAGLDTVADKITGELPGINLGDNGHFYTRNIPQGYVENHWFMTKANVSYQVEVIAEGLDVDVNLYMGRNSHPYSNGHWKSSTRGYPLMDGIVFKSGQDGIM